VQNRKGTDNFGIVVKSARQDKGLTQLQLADLLAITPRYLKAIENSGRRPSYGLLIRIIRELGIPADAVLLSDINEKTISSRLSIYKKYK